MDKMREKFKICCFGLEYLARRHGIRKVQKEDNFLWKAWSLDLRILIFNCALFLFESLNFHPSYVAPPRSLRDVLPFV